MKNKYPLYRMKAQRLPYPVQGVLFIRFVYYLILRFPVDGVWIFLIRNDLDPVFVRILDEINASALVLKYDTSHLFVQSMSCLHIVCLECEMEFISEIEDVPLPS